MVELLNQFNDDGLSPERTSRLIILIVDDLQGSQALYNLGQLVKV